MKKRPYNLQMQTPLGECEAAADTMQGLVEITPRGLFGDVLRPPEKKPEDTLDLVSRDLFAAFLERQKDQRVTHTTISKAGCELDLVRCFLRGLGIDETADYLCESSGEKISRSAVGRYWKELGKIGMDFKARL